MDKSNYCSSPMRRSIRLINAKRNEERSPIKFMTSAEAITVSDSETSSDEHVRKKARHVDSDREDEVESGSDNEDIEDDEEMEDEEDIEVDDE
ncbi:unnamed protein product [Rhodiola kirilowii]